MKVYNLEATLEAIDMVLHEHDKFILGLLPDHSDLLTPQHWDTIANHAHKNNAIREWAEDAKRRAQEMHMQPHDDVTAAPTTAGRYQSPHANRTAPTVPGG